MSFWCSTLHIQKLHEKIITATGNATELFLKMPIKDNLTTSYK